ncbi:hypothetical protein DPMN_095417 [Dreissena polymorpha]|uniref:Uncharacterized protein n=1 Tax=Dreissena polymorpha TaxID=45954 RepID=A0A9D4L9E6_DREPO|nr:hypothetical protein DPMN_095417 [Dreissena polymorpha]
MVKEVGLMLTALILTLCEVDLEAGTFRQLGIVKDMQVNGLIKDKADILMGSGNLILQSNLEAIGLLLKYCVED